MAIEKTLNHRMDELETALRALLYANNGFSINFDKAYLLTIAGQLRALVAMGGPEMTPLLLDLADEMNVPLSFYSQPIPEAPADDLVVDVTVSRSWSVKKRTGLQQYSLKEWLDAPAYFVDSCKDYRTRNQVLKHISNKEGGSHYDKKIVPIVDYMRRHQISTSGRIYDGVAFFLLDMAALVYWQGERLRRIFVCRQSGLDPDVDAELKKIDAHFDKLQYGISGIGRIEMFGTRIPSADIIKKDIQKRKTEKQRRRKEIAKQSRKKNR